MKILFFSPHPNLGLNDEAGYATHMRMVIEALRVEGVEVITFIAGGESQKGSFVYQRKTSRTFRFFKRIIPAFIWECLKDLKLLRFDYSLRKQLRNVIEKEKPDLVYERINYMQLSGCIICREQNIPHIAEINSPYIEERRTLQGKGGLTFLAKIRERTLLQQTHKVIVVSTALKQYFLAKYPFLAERKIVVIPNAVKTENSNDVDLSFSIEVPNKKTVIGFVGSIAPWHGIDLLIEVASLLHIKNVPFVFMIVGGGESLPVYKRICSEKKLDEYFIWVGSVPHSEVGGYIRQMDITIMPSSNWYGSPIKVFEYGLLKKPVIAPDLGPLRDVIENGKDGLLAKPDPVSIKDAIFKLIENKNFANELANNWHQKILANFTWQKVAQRIIQMEQELKDL